MGSIGTLEFMVVPRPSGTVTFLFTDVVGSTPLWDTHPLEMRKAMADHDRIIRSIVEDGNGYVFTTAGDSFAVAFSEPLEAMRAAVACQESLDAQDWGGVGDLRVRIGLDTGLATERDGDYFGPPLNRAARIMAGADGGKIHMSQTTADLVRHALPAGYRLADLGRKRLRGLDRPVRIHRLEPESAPVRSRQVMLILGGLAVLAIIAWATSIDLTSAPSVDTTPSPVAPPVRDTGGEVLWSSPVGSVTTAPLIIGNTVVTASHDVVTAHRLDDGTEVWAQADLPTARALSSVGAYVGVTTATRFEVLHPSTGERVPTCGFSLSQALAGTATSAGAVFTRSNSTHRVATAPADEPCHGQVIENTRVITTEDAVGPVVAGATVVVGDGAALLGLDSETLSILWEHPGPGAAALTVHPGSLTVSASEQRRRGAVDSRVSVAGADAEGILFIVTVTNDVPLSVDPERIRVDTTRAIAIAADTVVAVDAAGDLVGIDVETGSRAWTFDGPITAGPVGRDEDVLVGVDGRVILLDALDGRSTWEVPTTAVPQHVALTSGFAVTIESDDTMRSYQAPGDGIIGAADVPASGDAGDPEAIALRFREAWIDGDVQGVLRLLAPDAAVSRGAPLDISQTLWAAHQREALAGWIRYEHTLEAVKTDETCTTTPTELSQRPATRIRCEFMWSDLVLRASGYEAVEASEILVIENGLVRSAFLSIAPEHLAPHEDAIRWAAEDLGTGSPCRTTALRDGPCAEFIAAHVGEWLATADR